MLILKKYMHWIALGVLLNILVACAASKYEQSLPATAPTMAYARSITPPPPPAPVAAPFESRQFQHREQSGYLDAQAADAKPAAQQRKVHYEGTIKLVVNQPNKVIEQAIEWVRGDGGYVESLSGQQVVLQIPAARFRPRFDQILGLGDVTDKSLSARDVTEEFLDVDMRLTQAKATRDRLLTLVQKAQDSKEKLRLLNEVERLSAEIESLESQMALLRTLVNFSRLTLTVEGRKAFEAPVPKEPQGFDWITALASERNMKGDGARFALAVPQGLVELGNAQLWSAASPDGVTLGTQLRRNEPRGTTRFWVDALQLRLKARFDLIQQKTAGDFTVQRLVSKDEPRFVYWVAIAAKDDKLFVTQAFFPTLDHERRFAEPVLESLKGGVK